MCSSLGRPFVHAVLYWRSVPFILSDIQFGTSCFCLHVLYHITALVLYIFCIYQYKNLRETLYKTNAAIWYNKTCRHKLLMPNYISIKINDTNHQCINTIKVATHYRWNQGLKFLYIKKQKLNKRLYKIHLECAATWNKKWQLIQSAIDDKLQRQMKHNVIMSKENWTISNLNNNSASQLLKTTKNINDHSINLEYKI
jgi:hypothetical protein